MKTLITACLLSVSAALFVGCKSDDSNMVSPGAVTECGVSCEKACCDKDASMGAVGDEKAGCCKEKAGASMGAVGDEKSGCCKSKDGASMGAVSDDAPAKQCPFSGGAANDTSMGAVSDKPVGCCKSKTNG